MIDVVSNDHIQWTTPSRDQQTNKPAKNTNYEVIQNRRSFSDWLASKEVDLAEVSLKGLSYLGEYPLAWAACLCNETVYNLLVGESFKFQNSYNFSNLQMKGPILMPRTPMETQSFTWSSLWNNLVDYHCCLFNFFVLSRNVWVCVEAPNQEGEPSRQEPSGTHQSHPLLSAWKVFFNQIWNFSFS